MAEVSEWPPQEWAHRLLPLLTGEAQLAAHSLPAAAQNDFNLVARAIRDRLGLNPEEHRRRFRALALTDGDRAFTYAQQLRDQARRWLAPEQNTHSGAGGPGEVRRGASNQNIYLGPVPPAREPLGGRQHRGGPPGSPSVRPTTDPEPADRCSSPAAGQAHPGTEGEMG